MTVSLSREEMDYVISLLETMKKTAESNHERSQVNLKTEQQLNNKILVKFAKAYVKED